MGYDIHITRKEDWADESGLEIGLDEWLRYVASDATMRLDGFAEAGTPDGTVLRIESPGRAVWVNYSGHGVGGNMAWFDHYKDRVIVKNPDDEILVKMHEVAQALAAKVQGDVGEEYDAGGQPMPLEGGDGSARAKPWWRFWA